MVALCWRAGGRDWDLLWPPLSLLPSCWALWEGVDLVEAPASLSTVQAVTVTKPAPRLSGFGDSSFSLTRAAVICQNLAETFPIISITSA